MLKRSIKLIIFFFILSAIISAAPEKVEAHHNGDYFPIPRSQFGGEQWMETAGVWVWSYEQRCSSGNIYADINGAFIDTENRYAVDFIETSAYPNQKNISTCASDFIVGCSAGAVACVGSDYPGYPVNCDAKYNGPVMTTYYSFEVRKSIPKHEWMHCSTRRGEDYYDSGGALTCDASDSIMGCGSQAPKEYSQHDDLAWRNEHARPKPVSYGIDYSSLTFSWCNNDLPNDRRNGLVMSVFGYTPSTGAYRYAGQVFDNGQPCQSLYYGNGLITIGVEYLCFDRGNGIDWQLWWMRSDVCIGI